MAREREAGELAQRGAEAAGGATAARALLRQERVAALSTLSVRHPGAPHGSLVPYALSARGEPLLLLSALAQHSRNLEADPRAALLVFDGAAAAADPRTAPRLGLTGVVRRLAGREVDDARARYLARHPEARGLLALDFVLYQLAVEEGQLVAGFGAAGFFGGAELCLPDR